MVWRPMPRCRHHGTVPADFLIVSAAHAVPTSAGYTVLLLAHVASALVGFGAIGLTGAYGAAAAKGPDGPRADAVARYFRPGVNWAGRALYGVPVFGFGLLAASRGAFTSHDAFVVLGLVLWLVAAAGAELVVWPAERRIQVIVTRDWGRTPGRSASLARDCRAVVGGSVVLVAVFVAASVTMVGKP